MTQNISRRTLAKGAAWSVPAVVAAAPVYAAAASADQYSVDCSASLAFQITGVKPALTGEGTANGSSTWDIGVGQWSFPSGVTPHRTGHRRQEAGQWLLHQLGVHQQHGLRERHWYGQCHGDRHLRQGDPTSLGP